MAAHEAACGDQADYLWAFAEWSLSDPQAKAEWSFEQIERHWQSFTAEPTKSSMVTRASWFQVLEHFGKHYVAETQARVADELQDLITQSPIPVNRKNIEELEFENYANLLCISNHDDAIPVRDTDRRYMVPRCAEIPRYALPEPSGDKPYTASRIRRC